MELIESWVRSTIWALVRPWVIRQSTSDSRAVRPSSRPGQSPPISGSRAGSSLTTISPLLTCSRALTSSLALSRLER